MNDTTAVVETATSDPTYNKWMSRKFWLAVGVAIMATYLAGKGAIESVGYVTIIVADLGFYNAANVYQKITIGKSE